MTFSIIEHGQTQVYIVSIFYARSTAAQRLGVRTDLSPLVIKRNWNFCFSRCQKRTNYKYSSLCQSVRHHNGEGTQEQHEGAIHQHCCRGTHRFVLAVLAVWTADVAQLRVWEGVWAEALNHLSFCKNGILKKTCYRLFSGVWEFSFKADFSFFVLF